MLCLLKWIDSIFTRIMNARRGQTVDVLNPKGFRHLKDVKELVVIGRMHPHSGDAHIL